MNDVSQEFGRKCCQHFWKRLLRFSLDTGKHSDLWFLLVVLFYSIWENDTKAWSTEESIVLEPSFASTLYRWKGPEGSGKCQRQEAQSRRQQGSGAYFEPFIYILCIYIYIQYIYIYTIYTIYIYIYWEFHIFHHPNWLSLNDFSEG